MTPYDLFITQIRQVYHKKVKKYASGSISTTFIALAFNKFTLTNFTNCAISLRDEPPVALLPLFQLARCDLIEGFLHD